MRQISRAFAVLAILITVTVSVGLAGCGRGNPPPVSQVSSAPLASNSTATGWLGFNGLWSARGGAWTWPTVWYPSGYGFGGYAAPYGTYGFNNYGLYNAYNSGLYSYGWAPQWNTGWSNAWSYWQNAWTPGLSVWGNNTGLYFGANIGIGLGYGRGFGWGRGLVFANIKPTKTALASEAQHCLSRGKANPDAPLPPADQVCPQESSISELFNGVSTGLAVKGENDRLSAVVQGSVKLTAKNANQAALLSRDLGRTVNVGESVELATAVRTPDGVYYGPLFRAGSVILPIMQTRWIAEQGAVRSVATGQEYGFRFVVPSYLDTPADADVDLKIQVRLGDQEHNPLD